MKRLFAAVIILLFSSLIFAQSNPKSHRVKSYTKKDGTHVESHRSTNPNKTQRDNYSTKGNYNPSTGKTGTKKAKK